MLATSTRSKKREFFTLDVIFEESVIPNFSSLLEMFRVQNVVELSVDFN